MVTGEARVAAFHVIQSLVAAFQVIQSLVVLISIFV